MELTDTHYGADGSCFIDDKQAAVFLCQQC